MSELYTFLLAHWPLSLAFVVVLVAIVFYEWRERQSSGKLIDPTELTRLINHEKGYVVDVRDSKAFAEGHIIGSVNITESAFKDHQSTFAKLGKRPVIVVDAHGSDVGPMLKLLEKEGLTTFTLKGGVANWREEGLPLTKLDAL